MASGTDYESRKQALEVSFHRALRWMLNRLPTFAGGLIAVLYLANVFAGGIKSRKERERSQRD